MIDTVLFYIFGVLILGSAVMSVAEKQPMRAILYFLVCLLNVAGLFVLLDAGFIATAQVLLYAGAIVSMFMMAIMLLGAKAPSAAKFPFATMCVLILSALLLAELAFAVTAPPAPPVDDEEEIAAPPVVAKDVSKNFGSMNAIGDLMVSRYSVPFEAAAILILEAVIGVVLFTRRKTVEEMNKS